MVGSAFLRDGLRGNVSFWEVFFVFQNECPHFKILFILSFFDWTWNHSGGDIAVPCIDTHSYCPVFGDFTVVRLYPHLFCAFFLFEQDTEILFWGCFSRGLYLYRTSSTTNWWNSTIFFSHSCVMVLMEPSEEPKHFYSWMILLVPMIGIFGAVSFNETRYYYWDSDHWEFVFPKKVSDGSVCVFFLLVRITGDRRRKLHGYVGY